MPRRKPNVTAFLAGVLFVGIGLTYLVTALVGVQVNAWMMLATALIGLGLAGLAGALLHALKLFRRD